VTRADLRIEIIKGRRIECRLIGEPDPADTVLVFLHEGLGSVALWRDFPDRLCALTGLKGLIYSRTGYGGSDPCDLPRPLDYTDREADDVLPSVLQHFDIRDFVLIGHSDGATIALMYACLPEVQPARGLVIMAPHVMVEQISIDGILAAKRAYEEGDLRARLQKFHGANTENAFRGWSDTWLNPAFRDWNIEPMLPNCTAPVLAIQGTDDAYGTLAQIDAIEAGVSGPFRSLILDGCGHVPWRERQEEVLAAAAEFIAGLAPEGDYQILYSTH